MTREEAINKLKTLCSPEQMYALKVLVPELAESEDEKIRKELIAVINDLILPDEQKTRFNAYLEKQKGVEAEIEKAYKNADAIQYEKGFEEGVASVKSAEWSEEDEKMLMGIIERGSSQIPPHEPALRGEQMKWLMNRLKSLRPQPHWKPSEEQMKIFNEAIEHYYSKYWDSEDIKILCSLYDDLKKL